MRVKASELRRGDIIRLAGDSLRIEETPVHEKARVKIYARSAEQAGGCVRRSYLASAEFTIDEREQC